MSCEIRDQLIEKLKAATEAYSSALMNAVSMLGVATKTELRALQAEVQRRGLVLQAARALLEQHCAEHDCKAEPT